MAFTSFDDDRLLLCCSVSQSLCPGRLLLQLGWGCTASRTRTSVFCTWRNCFSPESFMFHLCLLHKHKFQTSSLCNDNPHPYPLYCHHIHGEQKSSGFYSKDVEGPNGGLSYGKRNHECLRHDADVFRTLHGDHHHLPWCSALLLVGCPFVRSPFP